MSEKKLHIEKGGVISKEVMLAYLRNEMDPAEKLHFEKLMQEDPFLNDAVEGLKMLDLRQMENSLESVHSRIDKITNKTKVFTISSGLKKYAAAASIVLFLGL